MEIVLKRGEAVDIKVADGDGAFRVIYGHTQLDVRATLPDSQGRKGLIYREKFGGVAALKSAKASEVVADPATGQVTS